jgi:hypothetical protein
MLVPLPVIWRNAQPNNPNTSDFQFKSEKVYSNGVHCFSNTQFVVIDAIKAKHTKIGPP